MTVTGAPWTAVRIRQSSNVKIGDFRFLASKGSQTSDGLRSDNKRGAGRSVDVQINSVYIENGGHHGVEMVDAHRFQADQVIGKDVSGTALILNKSTDATVNSVIGLNTGSEEEAYATFRLANYNENISVSNVVSRGGYRGMAIITDARHVTVGPKLNGIQLVDAQNVSINGGVIRNCGDSAVTIYLHLGEPANEGISVNNVRIVDDRPEGEREQSWAFTETDNSRYNRFVNNDIRGGGTEGLIRVGSETTVIRDNTGGGLASGKATLESGASPAARIKGVEAIPGIGVITL